MTYIDRLNAFHLWLESNALPASSQLMYFKLLNLFNRCGWPEYVQVDNRRLLSMIDVESEKTAIRARDRLVEAGFVGYQKGRKGSPNRYYLTIDCNNYSVSDSVCDSVSDRESDSEIASHNKTKSKTKTKEKTKRKPAPTLEEVQAYFRERKTTIDPESFWAYYEANGWTQGKTGKPIVNWKACLVTWEKRRGSEGQVPEQQPRRRYETVERDGKLVDLEVTE